MRGQMAGVVGGIIGIMIGVVILYMAVLPIFSATALNSTAPNLSGSALTLTSQIPLFLVLGVIITVLGTFLLARRG